MINSIFDIKKLFAYFDGFVNWLDGTVRFYIHPKKFILNLTKLKNKKLLKKLLEYFVFYESVILTVSATLIDKIQFNIFRISGFVIIDFILSIPLIFIIALSFKVGKIANPLKKSISFVLVFKIFIGIPIQVFLIFFIFFENYFFYILYCAGLQIFVITLIISSSVFFAESIKKFLTVLVTIIALFFIITFTLSSVFAITPSYSGIEIFDVFYDPIFDEFEELKERAKLLDEIKVDYKFERLDRYSYLIKEESMNLDLTEIKKDLRFEYNLINSKIQTELQYFGNKENYIFKSNRKRFELYIAFLHELSNFQEEYLKIIDIIELEIENKELEKQIRNLESEIDNFPDFKKPTFTKDGRIKLDSEEFNKIFTEELESLKLAVELDKTIVSKYEAKIKKQDNEIKILKLKTNIQNKSIKLYQAASPVNEIIIEYYQFVTKLMVYLFFI